MPSFDIVCETDLQEVDNAVNSVQREIANRYDFKGTNCSIERKENELTINADSQPKLDAIHDILKTFVTRRKLDVKVLDFGKVEKATGNSVRQVIKIKQGIDSDNAKKIVKAIKDSKMKVQVSIQGEKVKVDGKKRDDLQEVIAFVKGLPIEVPLQYINFRD